MKSYLDYSTYLKQKYGEKVYKLPINISYTCPNRDGTKGFGGCTFCSENGAGFECLDKNLSVRQQIEINRKYISEEYKAKKFIAYLQNYTNTYMPVSDFKKILEECIFEDIKEISISTRPDCVGTDYLESAAEIREKHKVEITFELGLQSANPRTLRIINRGHTLSEYINSVLKIKEYGFSAGTHLIPNLPYDDIPDIIEAAQLVSVLKTNTVKLHSLYLIKGTKLADDYLQKKFDIIGYYEYFERIGVFLEYLSPDIAVERFFARCPEEGCVFSNWGRSWRWLQNELMTYLFQNNIVQGSKTDYLKGITV